MAGVALESEAKVTGADRRIIVQMFKFVLGALYVLITGLVSRNPEGMQELHNIQEVHNKFFADLEIWYNS